MTKPRVKEDGEIAEYDSTPPQADDAYGAPTKVGEAAYQMLASALSSGSATFEQPKDAPAKIGPPPKSSRTRSDDTPIANVGDDAELHAQERVATVVIPSAAQAADALPSQPLAPAPAPPIPFVPFAESPTPPASPLARWRTEIIIGVVSFFVIVIPALIYILTN